MVTLTFNIIRYSTFKLDLSVRFKLIEEGSFFVVKLGGCDPAAAIGHDTSHVEEAGSHWGKQIQCTERCKNERDAHTPGGIGFLVLVPEGPDAAVTPSVLTPGSSSLILQAAAITFQ